MSPIDRRDEQIPVPGGRRTSDRRQLARLHVHATLVEGMLIRGWDAAVPSARRLPADIQIVEARFIWREQVVELVLQSASFKPLDDGGIPPLLEPPTFTAPAPPSDLFADSRTALTVCQPYAEYLIDGSKPIENRNWPTRYRGPLWIHAGRSKAWLDEPRPDLPFGALIGQVELVDCVKREELPPALIGNPHANGPWCWLVERPRRLATPIPVRGAQGLWKIELTAQEEKAARFA